jgi:hypothetical protein
MGEGGKRRDTGEYCQRGRVRGGRRGRGERGQRISNIRGVSRRRD